MTNDNENNGVTTRKGRPRGKPFEPGNPGRPKGARHKKTVILEKMMADDSEGIISAMIAAAKAGDVQAAKIVLERILPVPKGRRFEMDLPQIETVDDLAAAFKVVAGQMAYGEISPEEAATVASVLESRRRVIETSDLEKRIAAIEQREVKK